MKITIEKGRYCSVSIQGEFTGPYIDLTISPAEAYDLLLKLDARREELRDLVNNYHTCDDCGQVHHNSVKTCPVNVADNEE